MKKQKLLESLKTNKHLFDSKAILTENNLFAIRGGGSCPSKFTWTYWIKPDGMDSKLGSWVS